MLATHSDHDDCGCVWLEFAFGILYVCVHLMYLVILSFLDWKPDPEMPHVQSECELHSSDILVF